MYLALLFDEQDQLLAAAPGCDQQPLGPSYWREIYPQPLPSRIGETAVIDVTAVDLAELLLGLAYNPESLAQCRIRLAAYEQQQPVALPRRSHAA
ncbi:MAG: hypothetical protein IT423_02880 [Pirellulaceae bacterium]|nr:hypothetical protein [Pirellulaceae bacterium]